MKKLLSLFLLLLLPLSLLLTLPACSSKSAPYLVPAQVVAGQTLESVATSVNAAMNTYGVFYRAGELSPETIAKVRKLYGEYQTAATIANVAIGNDKAVAPADIVSLSNDLISEIASLK